MHTHYTPFESVLQVVFHIFGWLHNLRRSLKKFQFVKGGQKYEMEDKKMIVSASSKAEKVLRYIINGKEEAEVAI